MDIPSWPQAGPREGELLQAVLQSPQWGGFHPFVQQFEQNFADYQGSRFGIACCNGTLTLEAMLLAIGIGPGDEVVVPAISFIATATAVSRVGAVPVFVDIGRDTYNLSVEAVQAAIGPKTKAVMCVHFGGALCEMDRLREFCADRGLILLEDAAHAHGSEWNGQRAGSFGFASSFSFQNGKVLTAGEGGIIVTSDSALYERMRSLTNCGRTLGRSFYQHDSLGTNFRMSAWQAAVLLAQMECLDEQIERRTRNAVLLRRLLEGEERIVWQEIPAQVNRNSWYLLIGRLKDTNRDDFARKLTETGVPVTPFYPHTLYRNALYNSEPCRVEPCAEAEARIHDGFWLPHRLLLGDEQLMEQVAAHIRAALNSSR